LLTLNTSDDGCSWLPNIGAESRQDLWRAILLPSLIYYDKGPIRKLSLAQGLNLQLNRSSSEPRDNIYALLSVCKPIDIIPDYNKTVAEVFIEATRAVILQEKNLDILVLSLNWSVTRTHGYIDRVSLPSWVPHFEGSLSKNGLNDSGDPFEKQLYEGGGPVNVEGLLDTINERILSLQGILYGTIKSTGGSRFKLSHLKDIEWPGFLDTLEAYDIEAELFSKSDMHMYWRALLMDTYYDNIGMVRRRIKHDAEAQTNFESDLTTWRNSRIVTSRLKEGLEIALGEKTLCATSTGNMALVVGNVRIGDHVFYVRGATNPFILRALKHNNGLDNFRKRLGVTTLFKFVGGSYVHGLMDREVYGMIDGETIQEKTLYLV
jgi:hypothetical protein